MEYPFAEVTLRLYGTAPRLMRFVIAYEIAAHIAKSVRLAWAGVL